MNRHRYPEPMSARRTEPVLGNLDRLDDPLVRDTPPAHRRPVPPPRPQRRRTWLWLLVLLVVVVIAGVAWSQRQTLRSWMPQTQLNSLLERADNALAAGRLDGHQGDSARELYSAARALQSDNDRALTGLRNVGEGEFAMAREALAGGDVEQAEDRARKAMALLGGGSELDQLNKTIALKKAQGTKLASLVDRAAQALADGQLDGKHGAAALYRQVLTAEPGNAIARHGLDKVGVELATRVRTALGNTDMDTARKTIHTLAGLLPDFSDLPALRAEFAGAEKQAEEARLKLLAQADAYLAAGAITGSGDDNAVAIYQRVLKDDPDNNDARAGLQKAASTLLQQAGQRLDTGDLGEAEALLAEVGRLEPGLSNLSAARARMLQLRQKQADQPPAAAPITAQQRARAQGLVTRAQAAAVSGDLMLPPGQSAYDLYRSALALDPDNSDAMAGLASMPGQARSLFDEALANHDTARAARLLAAFAELAPGSSALPGMRSKLDSAKGARAH